MTTEQETVLRFWLDEIGPKRWYKSDSALDAEITRRFEPLWRRAGEGGCDHWSATPEGALALLILLDQFPRNMFRGTAAAFSTDAQALAAAKQAIRQGHDRAIPEPERQFLYLPLMHSEDLADQERCLHLIATGMPETGSDNLDHARKHCEVIRRFGRFPSRNAVLGRRDTDAEKEYRAGGGYMG
jgi:uncharacterized protein (DUF924 family)